MIFIIFYIMMMAGYPALGLLLGTYVMHYANATSLDLALMFSLQPFVTFFRVPFCAYADRHQAHKRLLVICLLWAGFSYIPFIVIPFLKESYAFQNYLKPRTCFWILVVSHLSGSSGFCGLRSLGDALAVNYAKRVGSDFGNYRKYGALSFGTFGYLLGLINQNGVLPDFVASVMVFVVSMNLLALLIFLWPNEHFAIVSISDNEDETRRSREKLPKGKQVLQCMYVKLRSIVLCKSPREDAPNQLKNCAPNDLSLSSEKKEVDMAVEPSNIKVLSARQQVAIFLVLLRRDFRIPLFLLLLFYAGFVGYAPQNFIFTYMDVVCLQRGTCNTAFLAGLVMFVYCLVETSCYMIFNALRKHLNYAVLIAITLASLSGHYLFYGFMLDSVSPYFFLFEALHGLEYSGSLCSSMELGYKFANEVELLIPELIQRGIISKHDDHQLVKVSLLATMTGAFTLIYDGLGTIVGALLYGIIIDRYSFTTTWIVIGSMATIGCVVVSLTIIFGKILNFKPQIEKLREEISA